MLSSLEYLHENKIVHRDLKLENMILDRGFNLKIADFGFARSKNIDCLKSYRGTFTYMAPEIKEGRPYRGTEVDMFSFGVILFIITHGIFPFKEARTSEYFYNLIVSGQHQLYFNKVNGSRLSPEFKELILALFSYDGSRRPTVEQVKRHAWLNKPNFDSEHTRQCLLKQLTDKQKSGKPLREIPDSYSNVASPISSPIKRQQVKHMVTQKR